MIRRGRRNRALPGNASPTPEGGGPRTEGSVVTETRRERAVTPEQFEREVVDLLPRLLATARRLTRNQAAAEDLVAEAVSRAWQRIDSLRDAGNFAGWLYRILTNTYISERRRRTA